MGYFVVVEGKICDILEKKIEFDNQANYIETWKPLKSYCFDSKRNCCADYCSRCVTLADEPLKMRV